MSKSIFVFFWIAILFQTDTSWNKVATISFEEEIITSSIDVYGRLYSCDVKGTITRFDTLGQKELVYSPHQPLRPTFVQTWNPNQIFVFYQELQEWVILNRFLTAIERYRISEKIKDERIGFVRIASPAIDNTLWLFDESDFSLKHYDIINQNLISQTPLDLLLKNDDYAISFLQAYQGQIFLGVQAQGILVFDNFGNYKKELTYPDWKSISFHQEELIIGFADKVIRLHLYTNKSTTLSAPPNKRTWQASFLSLSKWYWLNKHENHIYIRY